VLKTMKQKYNEGYAFKLSGEELNLAERELKSTMSGSCKAVGKSGKIIMTAKKHELPKRLSMTQEVAKIIHRGLREEISGISLKEDLEGSYAVRKEFIDPDAKPEKNIESRIGNIISNRNNYVDLDNPNTVIKAYVLEDEIILGRLEQEIDRGKFDQRKNQDRPFSSPVSLDPKLARTLVNLSGIRPGEHLLDPFCGTGGILIEAGLCGVGIAGTDIDEEMVEGCRRTWRNTE
jgi:Predicted DNA modification methylase